MQNEEEEEEEEGGGKEEKKNNIDNDNLIRLLKKMEHLLKLQYNYNIAY